ncbi:MAG: hypothetical protein HUK24_00210, partial [Sphaerochaetaceae bacterium]|nr:hypothetical protein [Sphaerochaetaceae bacterium]
TITYEDIEEFLTHTREENEFTLFAYIAKGKLDSALECLHTLLRTKDASTVSAMVASRLSTFFRRALSIQHNINSGLGTDLSFKGDNRAFSTKFFDSDRPISMPKDRQIYKECCERYSLRDIERILALLAEYDIKVKEVGTTMQEIVMERCLAEIIYYKGNKGRYIKNLPFPKL